jgi:hypothetical protein
LKEIRHRAASIGVNEASVGNLEHVAVVVAGSLWGRLWRAGARWAVAFDRARVGQWGDCALRSN